MFIARREPGSVGNRNLYVANMSALVAARPTRRTGALRRDLRAVDEDTRERLFPLLTEDELDAYQAAVEEQRERNRERARQ